MQYIPKVKTAKVVIGVSSGMLEGKLSNRGEYESGKLPSGGFNPVWNFKNNEPNDYFTRKQSPTSGGSKKG
jgi:hypothetical protein